MASALPFSAAALFLICCILEHIFDLFVSGAVSVFFSIIPSLVLLFMLYRLSALPVLQAVVVLAVMLRICIRPLSKRTHLLVPTFLILDILTLLLYFLEDAFDNGLLFEKICSICLVVLTMHGVQILFPKRDHSPFPIHFFLCLGILTAVIPMKSNPIDWTPVISLGERIAEGIEATADNASYFFSTAFGNTYTAGYSSLSGTGGRFESTDRLQLLLETDALPYRVFQNADTLRYEKVRKTLYLAGGKGVDTDQLIRFLLLLYRNGVDRERAALFCETQKISLEYVYLDTHDEIAPSTSFLITNWDKKIEDGVSSSIHKKGYRIDAEYLDIDYASPYLTSMFESEKNLDVPDYERVLAYAKEILDIDLNEILSRDRYERALADISNDEKEIYKDYLDVTGTNEELLALADDITAGISIDYGKCRQIEKFLRQYSYTEDSVGGYDESSDMGSPRGMADISQRFLFDSGRGYCVHFTSSMVMLLRLSGIPARAVTGYRYAFPFEKADEYSVSSSCAHTWPEAYIRGAGWVPFEPTSAYYSQSESTWHRYPAASDKAETSTVKELPPVVAAPQTTPAEENESHDQILLAVKVVWPVAASAILLLLLLVFGAKLYRFIRYRYSSPTGQLLTDVDIIKKNLVRISGHKIFDRGILSDYIPLAPGEMQNDLSRIFNVCYRLMYASEKENSPTPEENALARGVREKLEKLKTHKATHKSSA